MRPSRTVARAALIAALALGSLPGLVGSRQPSPEQPIDAAAFRQVILATLGQRPSGAGGSSDAASGSAGSLEAATSFVELGPRQANVIDRVYVNVPSAPSAWAWKLPKSTLSGYSHLRYPRVASKQYVPVHNAEIGSRIGTVLPTVHHLGWKRAHRSSIASPSVGASK